MWVVVSVVDVDAHRGIRHYEFPAEEFERALKCFFKAKMDFRTWRGVRVDFLMGDRTLDDVIGDEPWRLSNDQTGLLALEEQCRRLKPGESFSAVAQAEG